MTTEIFIRALYALAIAGIGIGVYNLTNRLVLRRALNGNFLGMDDLKPGIAAILYFTSPTCVPCKTVQRPAIQSVKKIMGKDLQVIEIDASASPEIADYWGVLSVPTTFIIGKNGQPAHINHGVTLEKKLLSQLEKYA
ncbi:MAG: thioredoxin family protein [Anaerolineae bacterium]|nr:thioredoxin family protein [Anaerolineae bacterium]MDK1118677.1 thioredoxin family protein [Anaerolineae bacterium]